MFIRFSSRTSLHIQNTFTSTHLPRHTNASQILGIRGLPQTSSSGSAAHHVWEARARLRVVHDRRSKRPSPRAVQNVDLAVERWRHPSPTHTARHSHVRRLERRVAAGSTRPRPAHLGPIPGVLGRWRLAHPPQQGHVPTGCGQVPDH